MTVPVPQSNTTFVYVVGNHTSAFDLSTFPRVALEGMLTVIGNFALNSAIALVNAVQRASLTAAVAGKGNDMQHSPTNTLLFIACIIAPIHSPSR